jgi:hypothetical protein
MQPENACKYYNKWQGRLKVKTTIQNLEIICCTSLLVRIQNLHLAKF